MTHYLRERLPDLLAALSTIGLGLFAFYESSGYDMGTLRAMEAGYFPRLMSFGLLGLGALLGVNALRGPAHRFSNDKVSLISLGVIAASLMAFALLVERFGLIPAIFSSVLLSTFASEKRNYPQAILLSAATAVICAVVFVYILGLSMKVFSL